MNQTLYDIRNLKYGYKWGSQFIPVLKGVNVKVPEKSFVCLVGPSGMGKTTLLNLMGFLDKPQEGELLFEGTDVANLSETQLEERRLRDLGFVFQSFYLIPTLTVLENTMYFLHCLGVEKQEAAERSEKTLELLGLRGMQHKLPLELSGGQRQRVAIARALVKRPKVILADEPTANLDHKTAEEIIKIFQELHRTQGVSFVFSTHDLKLVSYSSTVLNLNDGVAEVKA